MSRLVQVQGERPIFPGNACVHCMRPATQRIEIVKVRGYVVRKVDVPFCEDCIALRRAKSPRQVQFERLATGNSLLLALAAGAWIYTLVRDRGWVWGVLLAVLSALIVFGGMYMLVQPWSSGFRSPETKRVLWAATIRDFDWHTTTLEFGNEEYAERFAQVNRKE